MLDMATTAVQKGMIAGGSIVAMGSAAVDAAAKVMPRMEAPPGTFWVGLGGLITALVPLISNGVRAWLDDRREERQLRRDELDANVAILQKELAKLETTVIAKDAELLSIRKRWHDRDNHTNALILELQEKIIKLGGKTHKIDAKIVNATAKNADAIRAIAEASGVDVDVADAEPEDPSDPNLKTIPDGGAKP